MKNNLFERPQELNERFEYFQTLYPDSNESENENGNDNVESKGGIQIERIISTGHITPEGRWLEQEKNEWVVLIKGNAEILFFDERKFLLNAGDHLFIPAGVKHRVIRTSSDPGCIWLAVHFR